MAIMKLSHVTEGRWKRNKSGLKWFRQRLNLKHIYTKNWSAFHSHCSVLRFTPFMRIESIWFGFVFVDVSYTTILDTPHRTFCTFPTCSSICVTAHVHCTKQPLDSWRKLTTTTKKFPLSLFHTGPTGSCSSAIFDRWFSLLLENSIKNDILLREFYTFIARLWVFNWILLLVFFANRYPPFSGHSKKLKSFISSAD